MSLRNDARDINSEVLSVLEDRADNSETVLATASCKRGNGTAAVSSKGHESPWWEPLARHVWRVFFVLRDRGLPPERMKPPESRFFGVCNGLWLDLSKMVQVLLWRHLRARETIQSLASRLRQSPEYLFRILRAVFRRTVVGLGLL